MKFLLIALSLSVALIFNQVLCSNVKVNQAELRAVNDTALKVFDTLMDAIDAALAEANVALDAAVNLVNATVLTIEEKAEDAVNLAMVPINKMLNQSINSATSLGLNLTKCENYVDDLTELPNNMIDDLVTCATTQLDKAHSYADDAIEKCQTIEQDISTKYPSQISNCSGNIITELACLATIVTKMGADTIAVPVEISADVAKEVALITALVPAVTLCNTATVAKVPIEGAAIVAKFALCVGLPSNSTLPL